MLNCSGWLFQLSLEVPPPLMFPMTVTPLGRDQDCSLKNREPDVLALLVPGSWRLGQGAAVGLYFIFPGICTLSLVSVPQNKTPFYYKELPLIISCYTQQQEIDQCLIQHSSAKFPLAADGNKYGDLQVGKTYSKLLLKNVGKKKAESGVTGQTQRKKDVKIPYSGRKFSGTSREENSGKRTVESGVTAQVQRKQDVKTW
ncbi:hypothetical protein STEG23_006396, partial [Scotinomys teguina]